MHQILSLNLKNNTRATLVVTDPSILAVWSDESGVRVHVGSTIMEVTDPYEGLVEKIRSMCDRYNRAGGIVDKL